MPQGKPRDPRKEQHWRELIERWQHSGLSVRAFCQRHRLPVPSFYAWRRTLRQRDGQTPQVAAPVTFLPVHVRHHDPADPPPALELVLANGRCLRIPPGYDPAHRGDVVRALEGLPC
jgi:transposase-like protein